MKKTILFFFLLLFCELTFAQNKHSLNFSYGKATDFKWPASKGDWRKPLGSSSVAISYNYSAYQSLSIGTGLEMSDHLIKSTDDVDASRAATNSKLYLLSIPFNAKLTFLRYFYMNTGLSLDFDLGHHQAFLLNNQSGLGMRFGIGAELKLKNINFSINPILRMRSAIPFQPENGNQPHLLDLGVEYGVGYSF